VRECATAALALMLGATLPAQLRRLIGNAFRPVMGVSTGHYVVNLENKWDRIALRKLAELNNKAYHGQSSPVSY
jgi:hypothetical protein